MKRLAVLLALTLAFGAAAAADVEFVGPDLASDRSLLFAAKTDLPDGGSFQTLFEADPATGALAALTAYPERIALVDGGRSLLVQNRLGLFRTEPGLGKLAPVAGYPSFVQGAAIPSGRILSVSPSPDGSYLLFTESTSPAYCRLLLLDKASGKALSLAEGVAASVETFPARWSPDSRYFVYSKGDSLYYFGIEQFASKRLVGEEYRRLGSGHIGAVRWGKDGSLYYLQASSLYRILPAEFFTQALYQGLAGMGALAGKTPFSFDPNFDDFWVDGGGTRLIFCKDGRNLFLVYLNPDDFGAAARVAALPYLYLQGGTTVRDVLWPTNGPVTVFTASIAGKERKAGAYRFSAPLDPAELNLAAAVQELDVAGASELVLSPDEASVAVVSPAGVAVRGYGDWKAKLAIKAPGTLHALWLDNSNLVVAGSETIEAVGLAEDKVGQRRLLALAGVDAFGWTPDGSIVAKRGEGSYRLQKLASDQTWSLGDWAQSAAFAPQAASTASTSYRVYLESAGSSPYRNALMLRSVKSLGTRRLIDPPASVYASLAGPDDKDGSGAFNHGSRTRRREIALTFDALESAEGLTRVLNTLHDYGIKATFFVNGEFVRQCPGAARLLAESGEEVGSMFFSAVDPTDARFQADRDYLRRGLGRAEDDWFAVTGKELSLLWHTPYYSLNSEVLEAGASMNYVYVGRDLDPLDWVAKEDRGLLPGAYLDAHAIVERVVSAAKPGSVIPIRLGSAAGGRDDYLFLELDLLINALKERGYDIVPVSTLIDHAK
jgi:peptidoglycan/xylan/chitin deacetylase (PgdA/CDA1 family)